MSLDEAFLDVTENRVGSDLATPIAREIRARIHRELSLTASAGVGPNKLIAKLASDERKPNGLTVIRPDQVERFLSPLPVDRLWGVGPATAKRLAALGLRTVADVRKYPRVLLEHKLGEYGGMLHLLAHGIDPRPVVPHRSARSRGAERTFARDIEARDELEAELRELAWEVGSAVKMERRPGKTVNLKVRYADFTTITRAHSPGSWVVDAETILDHGLRLLRGESNIGHRPVRLLGLSLSGLMEEEDDRQLRLPFELSPQWLQETRP
jgi:DNA polymerase-4